MLVPKLREQLTAAMRSKDEPLKSVLRLVIAEVERHGPCGLAEAQKNLEFRVIRKLIEGNKETLAVMPKDDARFAALSWENEFLGKLLPTTLTAAEIKAELIASPVLEKLKEAKSDGQATGEAVKYLKFKAFEVMGGDVTAAVKEIRGEKSA